MDVDGKNQWRSTSDFTLQGVFCLLDVQQSRTRSITPLVKKLYSQIKSTVFRGQLNVPRCAIALFALAVSKKKEKMVIVLFGWDCTGINF